MVLKKAFPLVAVGENSFSIANLLNKANDRIFTRIIWVATSGKQMDLHCKALVHVLSPGEKISIDQNKLFVEIWNNSNVVHSFSFALCIQILKVQGKKISIQLTTALSQSPIIDVEFSKIEEIISSISTPSAEVLFHNIVRVGRVPKNLSARSFAGVATIAASCIVTGVTTFGLLWYWRRKKCLVF